MPLISTDRRGRRSAEFGTALRYQLESTLTRGRMAALALSDHRGVLVAWAGESGLCEELGAVAPLVARGAPPRLPGPALQGDDVAVRTVECFGEPLYLACLGGGVARDALLAHTTRGVKRILTAN